MRPNLRIFLEISWEKFLRTNSWEFSGNNFQDFLKNFSGLSWDIGSIILSKFTNQAISGHNQLLKSEWYCWFWYFLTAELAITNKLNHGSFSVFPIFCGIYIEFFGNFRRKVLKKFSKISHENFQRKFWNLSCHLIYIYKMYKVAELISFVTWQPL